MCVRVYTCAYVRLSAFVFTWTNYMFTNYWRQPNTHTHTIFGFVFHASPTSRSNCLWVSTCKYTKSQSQSKGNAQSGRKDMSSGNFVWWGIYTIYFWEFLAFDGLILLEIITCHLKTLIMQRYASSCTCATHVTFEPTHKYVFCKSI